MAHQMGIFPMKGTIDNISFFKTKDGFQARKKSGIDGRRILNDPKFKRTQEHIAEFGRAVKAGQLLRKALLEAITGAIDRHSSNRLLRQLLQVIQSDQQNPRGERILSHEGIVALNKFNFNAAGSLDSVLKVELSAMVDALTGECRLTIPPYDPEMVIKWNPNATHYRAKLVAAAINFEEGRYESVAATSPYFLLNTRQESEQLELAATLSPGISAPIFLALTMEYFQEASGEKYPLKNGVLNPCQIVKVHYAG